MNNGSRFAFNKTTLAGVTGFGTCFGLGKCHRPITSKIGQLLHYNDPLTYQQAQVVSNTGDCNRALATIKE